MTSPSSQHEPSRDRALSPEVAVYTGAFDPFTLGHLDVIERASLLFRRLIIGVGSNPEKQSLFTLEERLNLVKLCVRDIPRVTVCSFTGLAVGFVRAQGAGVIIRGLRSVTDLDYEFIMARANRALEPRVETVYLPASEHYAHISSTLIRQIAREADRADLSRFVPEPVIDPLRSKYRTGA